MASLIIPESIVKLPTLSIIPSAPKLPLWLIRLVSIIPMTGLFGVDHLLVGSNITASIKAIVPPSGYLLGSFLAGLLGLTGLATNILGGVAAGAWYLYDVAYVTSGRRVIENGFEIPFIGGGQFGKGRVTEKVMGGMERFVGIIAGGLLAIVMLAGAVAAYFFSGGATGATKNILTAVMWIAGGVGSLMALRTGFAILKPEPAPDTGALPPFQPGAAGTTAAAAAASVPAAADIIKAAVASATAPAAVPVQSGGGIATLTLAAFAEEIVKKHDATAFPMEEVLFFGTLAAVTIAGISYAVYRYKQKAKAEKDEVSGDAGEV